jgi:catechol 2,3-dioxygenase-like lactoylglutathione lyase family enzyme
MKDWYSRPVFFVADGRVSMDFYQGKLGCALDWNYEEGGSPYVFQVSRHGFELILQVNASKSGQGRVFISLDEEQVAALREDFRKNEVDARDSRWGMPIIEVLDPDGNELYFSPP